MYQRCLHIFALYLYGFAEKRDQGWVDDSALRAAPALPTQRSLSLIRSPAHQLQPNMVNFAEYPDMGKKLFRGFLQQWDRRPGIGCFNNFTSAMSKAFQLSRVLPVESERWWKFEVSAGKWGKIEIYSPQCVKKWMRGNRRLQPPWRTVSAATKDSCTKDSWRKDSMNKLGTIRKVRWTWPGKRHGRGRYGAGDGKY